VFCAHATVVVQVTLKIAVFFVTACSCVLCVQCSLRSVEAELSALSSELPALKAENDQLRKVH